MEIFWGAIAGALIIVYVHIAVWGECKKLERKLRQEQADWIAEREHKRFQRAVKPSEAVHQ